MRLTFDNMILIVKMDLLKEYKLAIYYRNKAPEFSYNIGIGKIRI